jgi:hypothetical protein
MLAAFFLAPNICYGPSTISSKYARDSCRLPIERPVQQRWRWSTIKNRNERSHCRRCAMFTSRKREAHTKRRWIAIFGELVATMEKQNEGLKRRDVLKTLVGGVGLAAERRLLGIPPRWAQVLPVRPVWAEAEGGSAIMPDTAVRSLEIGTITAPEVRFDEVDVDYLMKSARDAGVQCVMIYTMEHWGYALYPTKIGYVHPNLHYDYVGRQVEAARRYGLSPLAYYSYNFAQEVANYHPDWRMLKRNGQPERFRNKFNVVCQNSPYGDFMLQTFHEIFQSYAFDGLFLDIFPVNPCFYEVGLLESPFCYCQYCLALWEKEKGTSFRSGLDTIEGRRERIRWTRQKSGDEFVDRIYQTIRPLRVKATLAGNGGCLWFWRSLIEKLSYNYGEPDFSPSGICVGPILMRGWGQPHYQVGVWLRDKRTIADQVPTAILRTEAAAELASGARLFMIGSLVLGHLPKGFDSETITACKEALRDSFGFESLFKGATSISGVAVVAGEQTFDQYTAEEHPVDLRDSVQGALDLLSSTHYPLDAVPDWGLKEETLRQYSLVILPEVEVLSDAQGELLRNFVHAGGCLIASGRCGLKDEKGKERGDFLLAEVLGVHYRGEVKKYAGNIKVTGKELYRGGSIFLNPRSHSLTKTIGEGPVGLGGPYITIEGPAEELMAIRTPMFAEDQSRGVFFHWPPPPPVAQDDGKGVTVFTYGKGRALYLAVNLFREYKRSQSFWIQSWMEAVVRQLVPTVPIRVDGSETPGYYHATFWRDDAHKRLLVQIVNTSALVLRGKVVPLRGVRVVGNAGILRANTARVLWPEERSLELQQQGQEWHIPLPDLDIYTVVSVEEL